MPIPSIPSVRGFGILGVIGLIIAAGALVREFRNRHSIPIGLEKVESEKVESSTYSGRHILVTNCQLDLLMAVGKPAVANSRPSELLVPLRSIENPTGKVHAILLTRHPIYIATYLQLLRFKSHEGAKWVSQNRDMVFPKRSVEGVGRPEKLDDWPSLRLYSGEIIADFLLITDRPNRQRKWPWWLAGLSICLLFAGRFALQKR